MHSQGTAAQPLTAPGRAPAAAGSSRPSTSAAPRSPARWWTAAAGSLTRAQRPTPAGEDGATVMRAVRRGAGGPDHPRGWSRVTAVGIGSAGPVNAVTGTVSPVNVPGWRDFPLVEEVRAVDRNAPGHPHRRRRGDRRRRALAGRRPRLRQRPVHGGLHRRRRRLRARRHPAPRAHRQRRAHRPHQRRPRRYRAARAAPAAASNGWPAAPTSPATPSNTAGGRPDGADPTTAAVADAARAGDPVATAAFDRAAKALAAGIAACATLVEIEVAVIGGGVAGAGEVLFAPLRARLARVRHAVVRLRRPRRRRDPRHRRGPGRRRGGGPRGRGGPRGVRRGASRGACGARAVRRAPPGPRRARCRRPRDRLSGPAVPAPAAGRPAGAGAGTRARGAHMTGGQDARTRARDRAPVVPRDTSPTRLRDRAARAPTRRRRRHARGHCDRLAQRRVRRGQDHAPRANCSS